MHDLFWDTVSFDEGVDSHQKLLSSAKVATAHLWPFLSGAKTLAEFRDRKEIATEKLNKVIEASVPDANLRTAVRNEIDASLEADYLILEASRHTATTMCGEDMGRGQKCTKTMGHGGKHQSFDPAGTVCGEKIMSPSKGLMGWCTKTLGHGGACKDESPSGWWDENESRKTGAASRKTSLKPPADPSSLTPKEVSFYLVNALTDWDRKQESKPGHNPYALPQYFQAVDQVVEDFKRSGDLSAAVDNNFFGQLLNVARRALGLGKTNKSPYGTIEDATYSPLPKSSKTASESKETLKCNNCGKPPLDKEGKFWDAAAEGDSCFACKKGKLVKASSRKTAGAFEDGKSARERGQTQRRPPKKQGDSAGWYASEWLKGWDAADEAASDEDDSDKQASRKTADWHPKPRNNRERMPDYRAGVEAGSRDARTQPTMNSSGANMVEFGHSIPENASEGFRAGYHDGYQAATQVMMGRRRTAAIVPQDLAEAAKVHWGGHGAEETGTGGFVSADGIAYRWNTSSNPPQLVSQDGAWIKFRKADGGWEFQDGGQWLPLPNAADARGKAKADFDKWQRSEDEYRKRQRVSDPEGYRLWLGGSRKTAYDSRKTAYDYDPDNLKEVPETCALCGRKTDDLMLSQFEGKWVCENMDACRKAQQKKKTAEKSVSYRCAECNTISKFPESETKTDTGIREMQKECLNCGGTAYFHMPKKEKTVGQKQAATPQLRKCEICNLLKNVYSYDKIPGTRRRSPACMECEDRMTDQGRQMIRNAGIEFGNPSRSRAPSWGGGNPHCVQCDQPLLPGQPTVPVGNNACHTGCYAAWQADYGDYLMQSLNTKQASMQKGAPFADYKDFDSCVAANSDKDNPSAYCGYIKHKTEDKGKKKSARLPKLSRNDQGMAELELELLGKTAGPIRDLYCTECGTNWSENLSKLTSETVVDCPKCGSVKVHQADDPWNKLAVKDCSMCKGSGDCTHCDGSGETQDDGETYSCEDCDGSGDCTKCKGAGTVTDPTEADREHEARKTAQNTKRVQVYLNEGGADAMFGGYKPGDPMKLAIEYDQPGIGGDLDICEDAYREFNIGNDPAFTPVPSEKAVKYREKRNRSLSVGDVVVIDGTAYKCDALGFSPALDFTASRKHAAGTDVCPGCDGPITYLPGDKDFITVFFQCPNPTCDYGKLSPQELAQAAEYGSAENRERIRRDQEIRRGGSKVAMPNPIDLGVKVGDIFYSSWGYDQTNVDFYEVTGLTGASVRVRPIASQDADTGGVARQWSGSAIPVPGEYTGPESIHRLVEGGFGRPVFKINSVAYAYPWEGQPVGYSTYASRKQAAICPSCHGDGLCNICGGMGCPDCEYIGVCPECSGRGTAIASRKQAGESFHHRVCASCGRRVRVQLGQDFPEDHAPGCAEQGDFPGRDASRRQAQGNPFTQENNDFMPGNNQFSPDQGAAPADAGGPTTTKPRQMPDGGGAGAGAGGADMGGAAPGTGPGGTPPLTPVPQDTDTPMANANAVAVKIREIAAGIMASNPSMPKVAAVTLAKKTVKKFPNVVAE